MYLDRLLDTIDGITEPRNVISRTMNWIDGPTDIVLDRRRDHIYEVNDPTSDDVVRVWHYASGADGNFAPNRTLSNSAGLLDDSKALSFISG